MWPARTPAVRGGDATRMLAACPAADGYMGCLRASATPAESRAGSGASVNNRPGFTPGPTKLGVSALYGSGTDLEPYSDPGWQPPQEYW